MNDAKQTRRQDVIRTAVLPTSWLLVVLTSCLACGQHVTPLPRAHAHNDYVHPRPLLDALDNGFCSVEADIFLIDGELRVGHARSELTPARTLRKLYLQPLRERVRANGGRVYPGGPVLTLLIDIKTDGAAAYRVLHRQLGEYQDVFSRIEDGVLYEKAVTAIISGNRPQAAIAADSPRYASVDGRLPDLDGDKPAELIPLISDNWGNHFAWRGSGDFPAAERTKLEMIVQKAHRQNRRIRFWATPDKPEVWQVMVDTGVDLINTDKLAGLSRFLRAGIND